MNPKVWTKNFGVHFSFRFLENILSRKDVSYSSVWYKLNGNNKNPLPIGKNIYHIFGDAKDGYDWVYDEKMLLGCNMPDWLFRFLWYPIYSNHEAEGEHGYWINNADVEDSFDAFLQDVNYASNEDLKEILEEITKKKKELVVVNKENKTKNDKFDVFISYASEDFEIVKMIYEILSNRNIDAWFDEDGNGRIIEGENYMNKIKESVPKCRYYMPIVTESFLKKSLLPESNLSIETSVINNFFNTLANGVRDTYSLPIIISNQKFNGNDIDTKLVEGLSALGILKPHFYYQKKMIPFDVNSRDAFMNLDWETIIKKSN